MLPFLARGITQISSSHSLDPLKAPPCFPIVVPNLSHPIVYSVHGKLCPSSNIQKTPQQSLSIQAFSHSEQTGTEICWIAGEGTIKEVFYVREADQAKGE